MPPANSKDREQGQKEARRISQRLITPFGDARGGISAGGIQIASLPCSSGGGKG